MKTSPGEAIARITEAARHDLIDCSVSELTLMHDVIESIISGEADIVLRSPASTARYCQLANAVEILRDMRVQNDSGSRVL